MILCKKRKIGVLFNPKTGSSTLSKLFETAKLDINRHDHNCDLTGLEDYTLFAFYREPVERYMSGLNYIKRLSDLTIELLHYFYSEPISCAKFVTYNTLTDRQKKMIDDINPMHYFDEFVKRNNGGIVFRDQRYYLDAPNIIPLDFRDFDNQVKYVCGLFDINVETVPRINERRANHKVSDLTENDKSKIRAFYQADYDYFKSKSIVFN